MQPTSLGIYIDVIELLKKRHTKSRADFRNMYAANIDILSKKMKQY